MRSLMWMPIFLLCLSLLSCDAAKKQEDKSIVLKLSADKTDQLPRHFSGEWLESPWGSLYQFRAGDQSWLTAREHCLSLNSDLAIIRDKKQLDWILSHYAPISSRFARRLVQVGLYSEDGSDQELKWLDESVVDKEFKWTEKSSSSSEGEERCGVLNVDRRAFSEVDCEFVANDHHAVRYVCERSSEKHKEQQKSNNYIWGKIEQLFSFFGIGTTPATNTTSVANNETLDYEDEVKRNESRIESDEESSSEEEKNVEKTLSKLNPIGDEVKPLKEIEDGDGLKVNKKSIEQVTESPLAGIDEEKLDKMISKMEEMIKSIDDLTTTPASIERTTIQLKEEVKKVEKKEIDEKQQLENNQIAHSLEDDFDEKNSKDMPKADIQPPRDSAAEEDCEEGTGESSGESSGQDESSGEESGEPTEQEDDENESSGESSGEGSAEEAPQPSEDRKDKASAQTIELSKEKEEHVKEFLGVLRLFLDRAEREDLKKLLNENSGKTLLERMKNAIQEANKREFEMLEKMEAAKKNGESTADIERSKENMMSPSEQKEIYKKISSAVMKVAANQMTLKEEELESSGDKFDMAREKLAKAEEEEGKVELIKSAKESHSVTNDDYYGDYLDDSNVVKVHNKKEKKLKTTTEEAKKEDDNKVQEEEEERNEPIHLKAAPEESSEESKKEETAMEEEKKESKVVESKKEEEKKESEKKETSATKEEKKDPEIVESKKEEAVKVEEKKESKSVESKKEEEKKESEKNETIATKEHEKEESEIVESKKEKTVKEEEKKDSKVVESKKEEEKKESEVDESKKEEGTTVKEEQKKESKKEEIAKEEEKKESVVESKKEESHKTSHKDAATIPKHTVTSAKKEETKKTSKTAIKPTAEWSDTVTEHPKNINKRHHEEKKKNPKKDEEKKVKKPRANAASIHLKSKPEETTRKTTTKKHTTTTRKPTTTTKHTTTTKKPTTTSAKTTTEESSTLFPTLTTLPTLKPFTFPTIGTPKPVSFPTIGTPKPVSLPTLPTLPTTTATPLPTFATITPAKVPTLEEILGNLNDQFKNLLKPPTTPKP